MAVRTTKLDELTPDHSNANRGTERGRYALEASLRKYGAGRSILVDRNGRIIAGNKTAETAADVGIDDVIVVQTDGRQVVAVQRTDLDLDSKEARELAYADNRVGQLDLDFDPEQLLADLQAGVDLEQFWRKDELDELLADLQPKGTEGDTPAEVDRAEELRQKWGTCAGQLWALGEHRLIVGDCTDAATVARVMGGERAAFCMTDPPYGANYTGGTKKWEMLKGDRTATLYAPSLALVHEYTEPKAALYLFFSDEYLATIDGCLRQAGYDVRAQLIWNKNHAQFGAMGSQYKQKHEPLFYAFKHGESPYWFGPNNEVTVWDIARASANEYHPTEKPPALYERALANSAPAGCIVYEPFSGSGTSIIACENTNRRCRAIELDAGFVATTLERWSVHAGRQPVLVEGA